MGLSIEEKDLLNRAKNYEELKATPGWQDMLSFLTDQCSQLLARKLESQSSNMKVVYHLDLLWKQYERVFQDIQQEIDATIKTRDQWLLDVRENYSSIEDLEKQILGEELDGAKDYKQ